MSQPLARLLGRSDDRREQRSIIDALHVLAVLGRVGRHVKFLCTNASCATLRMAGESGARAKSQVTAGLGWESSEGEDEAAEVQQEQEQRQRERQEAPSPPPPPPPSRKPKRQKVTAATPVSAPSPNSSKA